MVIRRRWLGLSVPLVAGALASCTSAPEREDLPQSQIAAAPDYRYQARPDAPPPPPAPAPAPEPEPEPELEAEAGPEREYAADVPRYLLSASAKAPVWAASDHAQLWVGVEDVVRVIDRGTEGVDGAAPSIAALDVDDDGRVWIIEDGGRLLAGVFGATSEPLAERGEVPLDGVHGFEVIGGQLIVLGYAQRSLDDRDWDRDWATRALAVSQDGRDWTIRATPDEGNMGVDLSVTSDGVVQIFDAQEAGCGGGYQSRAMIRIDAPIDASWTTLDWPFDATFNHHAGPGGWSFVFDSCPDWEGERQLCAVDPDGVGHPLGEVGDEPYALATDHGRTLVLTKTGLWSVHEGEAERLDSDAADKGQDPGVVLGDQDRATAVDSENRLLMVVDDRLHLISATGRASVALPR